MADSFFKIIISDNQMMIRQSKYYILKNTGHESPPNRRSAKEKIDQKALKTRMHYYRIEYGINMLIHQASETYLNGIYTRRMILARNKMIYK